MKFAEEQVILLAKRVLQVWKLVCNCIEDKERCGAELQKGNEALNQVREERSQKSDAESSSIEGDLSKDDLESLADSLEKVRVKVQPSAPSPPRPPSYDGGGEVWMVSTPRDVERARSTVLPSVPGCTRS